MIFFLNFRYYKLNTKEPPEPPFLFWLLFEKAGCSYSLKTACFPKWAIILVIIYILYQLQLPTWKIKNNKQRNYFFFFCILSKITSPIRIFYLCLSPRMYKTYTSNVFILVYLCRSYVLVYALALLGAIQQILR